MTTLNSCEACKKNQIEVIETADEPRHPYKLCHSCHERLLKCSLRPIKWYNLAVIHSSKLGKVSIGMFSNVGKNEIVVSQRKTTELNCVRYNGELCER